MLQANICKHCQQVIHTKRMRAFCSKQCRLSYYATTQPPQADLTGATTDDIRNKN